MNEEAKIRDYLNSVFREHGFSPPEKIKFDRAFVHLYGWDSIQGEVITLFTDMLPRFHIRRGGFHSGVQLELSKADVVERMKKKEEEQDE